MTHRRLALNALGWTLVMGLFVAAPTATVNDQEATRSLALASSRVSIAGTSNIHAFTASTSTVRVTRFQFATGANPTDWEEILKPGAIEALEFVIPVQTLKSEKDGLDKNMHKALKAQSIRTSPSGCREWSPMRRRVACALRHPEDCGRRSTDRARPHHRTQRHQPLRPRPGADAHDRLRHRAAEGDARHVEN